MGTQKIFLTELSRNMRKGLERIKKIKVTPARTIQIPNQGVAEYWIGLKNLSRYTHPRCHWELNITVWDFQGKTSSGHYSRFFIKEGK